MIQAIKNMVMKRYIIRFFLLAAFIFTTIGVQAQNDPASLEAMIQNHKQVRGVLEVRLAAEVGLLKYHKINAEKVNDYRVVSDTLDRYRRCMNIVDLILKTGATAFHTVNASKRVTANVKGYWELVDTYTNKILLHGAVWPSDTIILTTSKKTVNAIEEEAKQLMSSYNEFVTLLGGKNSPKETKVLDMMECLDKINTSIDNIDDCIAAAYTELWGYMTVRMGFWKKEIYRAKSMQEILNGAYGDWVKAQAKAYTCLQEKKSYTPKQTLGGGGLLGERRRKEQSI